MRFFDAVACRTLCWRCDSTWVGAIVTRAAQLAASEHIYACVRPQSRTNTGSVLSIAWSADGTALAAAGGSGAVAFGQLVAASAEDGRIAVTLEEPNKLVAQVSSRLKR